MAMGLQVSGSGCAGEVGALMAGNQIQRNSRLIMQRLRQEGWVLEKSDGSHHKMTHADFQFPIIVPHPKKDLPIGTARSIVRAAGWLGKS